MKKYISLILLLSLASVFAMEQNCHPRPVEITQGQIKRRPDSVVMKDQDLSRWRIESQNVSNVSLALSGDYPLWEDQVAKLSFTVDDPKKTGLITLYPTPALSFNHGNMMEFWVNGPQLFHGFMIAHFQSYDGRGSRTEIVGGGHQWNRTSFWGTALTSRPPVGLPPWQLVKLEITIKPEQGAAAGKPQALYFDEFASLTHSLDGLPTHWREQYPRPTTPDTILPALKDETLKNSLTKVKDTYSFKAGKDLTYRYTPRTGTFSDLEIELGNGTRFQLTSNGGPQAEIGKTVIRPDDPAVEARLLSCKIDGNTLKTQWSRSKDNASFNYRLDFEIRQKTLIVKAESDEPVVALLPIGQTAGTPGIKLVPVSYFNTRHSIPYIAYVHGVFAACTLDWYNSNATAILDDGPDQSRTIGPVQSGPDTVRVSGGSIYRKLSDGSRNRLSDRLFITVSQDIAEVLPNIANSPSPYLDITSRMVYCSRVNFLTRPEVVDEELAFWARMRAYGLDDIFMRFHMEVFGTPLESNRIARELDTYAGLGDAALHKLIDGLHALGYKVAGYQNAHNMHGLAPEYHVNKIALDYAARPHQRWAYNNYLPRACVQVQHTVDFMPAYKKKWGWDGVYSDEVSNIAPWGHTDYEAGAPGAGKLTEVLYGYMLLLNKEKEILQGPVWSEGTAHYFRAGYTDMNYAQSNYPDQPIVPEFQLRKIHLLENDIGYDLTAARRGWTTDYWLASTIIFGNVGSIHPGVPGSIHPGAEGSTMMQGPANWFSNFGAMTKSYFMIRALQECYSGIPPASILYADNQGKPVPLSQAIAGNTLPNNQIYTRYANGLEVWVNRHDKKSWTIDFDGRKLELPPTGYAAKLDGRILEYSAGNPRSDYVASNLYHYADGRGTRTEFPDLAAAGAYMWRKQNDGVRLIPQAPVKPENIVLKEIGKVLKIIALDQSGAPLPYTVKFNSSPEITEIEIDPRVFQYQILQTKE